MSGLHDIPGKGKGKLSEEKLLAYLEGRLPAEEQHEVEQWLADEGMESDAVDGLKQLEPAESRHSVDKRNSQLRRQLKGRKPRRKPVQDNRWGLIAVVVILLLCIAGYLVLKMMVK